ncbi:MAG: hypothetical protein JWN86_2236 [Planctomycetota bacterium]|nr:hypothetical protein [Planctomycetota bacterium]
MTNTKHTPGPWAIQKNVWHERPKELTLVAPDRRHSSYRTIHPVKEGGELAKYPIAMMNGDPRPRSENEANARLIAAAPELLEALEVILGSDGYEVDCIGRDMVRAAVAKARGEAA